MMRVAAVSQATAMLMVYGLWFGLRSSFYVDTVYWYSLHRYRANDREC